MIVIEGRKTRRALKDVLPGQVFTLDSFTYMVLVADTILPRPIDGGMVVAELISGQLNVFSSEVTVDLHPNAALAIDP